MPLTRTQLAAACKANDLTLSVVTTSTGFPGIGVISAPQQPLQVDQEMMFLVQVVAPNTILVRSRGADGTLAIPHDVGAPVTTSAAPGDFPAPAAGFTVTVPPESPSTRTYGQSGALVIPQQPAGGTAILNGPAALAMTLGAPSPALTGVLFTIFTQTPFAHTISLPGLLVTGAAGGPFSTITFPATVGAQVDLIEQGGFWSVGGSNGAVVYS